MKKSANKSHRIAGIAPLKHYSGFSASGRIEQKYCNIRQQNKMIEEYWYKILQQHQCSKINTTNSAVIHRDATAKNKQKTSEYSNITTNKTPQLNTAGTLQKTAQQAQAEGTRVGETSRGLSKANSRPSSNFPRPTGEKKNERKKNGQLITTP